MDSILMTITIPNYLMGIISLTLATDVFKKSFFFSMKPTVSSLNFPNEQLMRFAGNGELYCLLFSIFYFFSNPFTSVPFLHHFPAIFTRRAQNKSETGRGLLLCSLHCYFLRCFLVIYTSSL